MYNVCRGGYDIVPGVGQSVAELIEPVLEVQPVNRRRRRRILGPCWVVVQ